MKATISNPPKLNMYININIKYSELKLNEISEMYIKIHILIEDLIQWILIPHFLVLYKANNKKNSNWMCSTQILVLNMKGESKCSLNASNLSKFWQHNTSNMNFLNINNTIQYFGVGHPNPTLRCLIEIIVNLNNITLHNYKC